MSAIADRENDETVGTHPEQPSSGPEPEGAAQVAQPAKPRRRSRIVEWFWRGDALRRATEEQRTGFDERWIAQVRESVELADRLVERVAPPRTGSGLGSALVLYRDALLTAAGAFTRFGREALPEGSDPLESLRSLLEKTALAPSVRDSTATELLAVAPASLPALAEVELEVRARGARTLLHAVVVVLDAPARARARAIAQRLIRTGILLCFLLSAVIGAIVLMIVLNQPPNLLANLPWRTSSTYAGFSVEEGKCDGRKTKIFFHTDRERDAFIEYKSHQPIEFRHLELVNRRDCCEDRATPLVVEVSDDGKAWREVLRHTKPFTTLHEELPPTKARYIRVRALRKTWLHLERVAVW